MKVLPSPFPEQPARHAILTASPSEPFETILAKAGARSNSVDSEPTSSDGRPGDQSGDQTARPASSSPPEGNAPAQAEPTEAAAETPTVASLAIAGPTQRDLGEQLVRLSAVRVFHPGNHRQTTYGFSELGLTGSGARVSATGSLQALQRATIKSMSARFMNNARSAVTVDGSAASYSAVTAAAIALSSSWSDTNETDAAATSIDEIAQTVELQGVPASELAAEPSRAVRALAGSQGSAPSNELAAGSDASPDTRARQPSTASSSLNVIVTEEAGYLQILTASPPLTLQAQSELLRIASQMSEDLGLNLSELRHNGTAISSPQLSTIGDTSGRSSH